MYPNILEVLGNCLVTNILKKKKKVSSRINTLTGLEQVEGVNDDEMSFFWENYAFLGHSG